MTKKVVLVSACDQNNYLMLSYNDPTRNESDEMTFKELDFVELADIPSDDVRYMYIAGTDFKSPGYIECWSNINPGGNGNETLNGYVFIDSGTYTWDWTAGTCYAENH